MTPPDIFACPHCKRTVRRTDRFCPGCGWRIGVRSIRATVNGLGITLRVRDAVPIERAGELADL